MALRSQSHSKVTAQKKQKSSKSSASDKLSPSKPVPNPIVGKLSTDYLNCFNEIMMVIELAAEMPEMIDELKEWRPITYVEHFEKSGLRHAEVSIAGYTQLPPLRRQEFDILSDALNRLAVMTISSMADSQEPTLRKAIADIATKAFGYHITRAADFINANGENALDINVADLQNAADEIMACG
jgi:hypothetical protein